jgi:hypothetical protein
LEGVQAEVDADETLLRADGTAAAAEATTTLYAVNDIDGETVYATTDTDAGTVVPTGTTQEVELELSAATIGTVVSFEIDGTQSTVTVGDPATTVTTDLPNGYSAAIDGTTLTVTGPEDTSFVLSDESASGEVTISSAVISQYYLADDAEPAGYVADATNDLSDGFLAEDAELLEFETLASLQQEMLNAEADLASSRDANSDADLLDSVRAEISDYIGAGGDDVGSILTLRNTIRDLLNGDDFDAAEFELDSDNADEFAESGLITSEVFLTALTTGAGATLVEGEAVVASSADAPTGAAGQGEWVQGDEVAATDPVEYEWTYQPSAEEQALLGALSDVEDRQAQITAETQTESTFENAVNADGEQLGAQLGAIEDRLVELANAEQAVVDAQTDLDDANELIGGLEAALADQATAEAWFEENDYALPIALDGAESGTDAGDIFLFEESEGGSFSISGFGEEGQDTLYFGGEFSLVSLAEQGEEGLEITDRVGNNDTLEIFWAQDGDDLQLYVEAEAAAGFDRGTLATEQMTQITLENFTAEDIADFTGQSLIAGVAPTTEETIA